MVFVVVAFIVFMERAQRRVPITYPRRQVGNKMYEGQSSFLPLKLNTAGVIPPIFASSLLLLPTTVGQFRARLGEFGASFRRFRRCWDAAARSTSSFMSG